jgi:hypothetical protein
VARSWLRRSSSWSPSSDADNGVSTKPAATRLTRTSASSSAKLAASAGSSAVSAETIAPPTPERRASVPLMNSSVPPGRTLPAASRATWSVSQRCSSTSRCAVAKSMSARRA